MSLNLNGPASAWITGEQLRRMPGVQKVLAAAAKNATRASDAVPLDEDYIAQVLVDALGMATEVLYRWSGSFYVGEAGPITLRPLARPVDADTLGLIYRGYGPNGYGIVGPGATSAPPAISSYGVTYPPTIELYGYYPVRRILSVYIDGVLIPEDEYELRDAKHLVRIMPTRESTPTERYGWPTSQRQDLPDTQMGTFSVTFTHGADPGVGGRRACLALAQMLACVWLGDTSQIPQRTVNIVRQGVSMQSVSALDVLKSQGTGIYEVDLWLQAVNPTRRRAPALVLSPDRPLAPRQGKRYQ